MRTVPLAAALSLFSLPWLHLDTRGVLYAMVSGAVTSGLGYVMWYRVLQHMHAMTAATVQLGSPILATLGGVAFLGEALTRDLMVASLLILGGIWLVLRYGKV